MARQITITHTHESYTVSFDSQNTVCYAQTSGYPAENGIGDGSGYFAGFDLTRGSNAETFAYYNFDCSAIPDDATITNVTCNFRASVSTTNTKRISTANLALCTGTTVKGSTTSIMTTTATYFDVNGGSSWTVAQIKNCKIRGYAKRGTNNTSTQYTLRLFGGTLTVTYTVQGMLYTITATSNVDGETVEPSTQEINEGDTGIVKINTTDMTNKTVTDNNTNVTNSVIYVPPDTGGDNVKYPSAYDTGGSGTISGINYRAAIGHGVSNPSSNTGLDKTTKGGDTAIIYFKFDFSDLPDDATINSMTVQIRYKVDDTRYAQSVNTYSGTSTKGTSVTLNSTSNTTATISSPGTWTAAQLKNDPRVGVTVSYSGVLVTGVTWTVNYTADVPAYYQYVLTNVSTDHTIIYTENAIISSDHFYIKQNGTWNEVVKIYHKENGLWVEKTLSYLSDNNIDYLQRG